MFKITIMTLGQKIESILEALNMKQAELIRRMHELAPEIQYSNLQVSVSNTIKRKSESSKYLQLIAKALQMSTEDILNWTGKDDGLKAMQELANYNVSHVGNLSNQVVLIDIDKAKDHKTILSNSSKQNILTTDAPINKNTFAVEVPDKSMDPVITQGMIAIINPELSPVPNDLVLAEIDGSCLIRQLTKLDQEWYLESNNAANEKVKADECEFIGVVIQAQLTKRFK